MILSPEFCNDGAAWGDDAKRDKLDSRHARERPDEQVIKTKNEISR